MAPAERAVRALRVAAELDVATLGLELRQTAERLAAAARREARLADRHAGWCEALRACLAAVPIDPHRVVELERRRRAARVWLERAHGETRSLHESEGALRAALGRAQHRDTGLQRVARTLQAAERARRADSAARELEDSWNARAAGAGE